MGTCSSPDRTKLLESLCISHYFRGVVIYSNVISSTLFQSKRFFKLSFLRIAGKYRPFKKVMSLRTSSALTSGNPRLQFKQNRVSKEVKEKRLYCLWIIIFSPNTAEGNMHLKTVRKSLIRFVLFQQHMTFRLLDDEAPTRELRIGYSILWKSTGYSIHFVKKYWKKY